MTIDPYFKDNEIHMISFRKPKDSGYHCLLLGQGQRPDPWHIEKLRALVADYDAGKFNSPTDDYSDLV